MANTMRERIARAMMDNVLGAGSYDEASWGGAEAERQVWLSHADAALAAMREPTDAMYLAGERGVMRLDVDRSYGAWTAMIDAARNEEASGE